MGSYSFSTNAQVQQNYLFCRSSFVADTWGPWSLGQGWWPPSRGDHWGVQQPPSQWRPWGMRGPDWPFLGRPKTPRERWGWWQKDPHTLWAFHLGSHTLSYCKYDSVCVQFVFSWKKYYHPMRVAKRHRQKVTRRARSQKIARLWSRSSAGDEGDFVLVRKDNGIEGWTKVKNLSSAALPLDCVRRSIPEVLKAPANWVRYSSSQHGPCWSFQILLQSLVRES